MCLYEIEESGKAELANSKSIYHFDLLTMIELDEERNIARVTRTKYVDIDLAAIWF